MEREVVPSGYERFFSEPGVMCSDVIADDTIVSVRRSEQITTLIGSSAQQNKIKISLSQEQIVNGFRGNGIRRSQSINIQKNVYSPLTESRREFVTRNAARKPSQIPVKIVAAPGMFASLNSMERPRRSMQPMHLSEYGAAESEKSRISRKFSMPTANTLPIDELRTDGHSLPYIPSNGVTLDESDSVNDQFRCKFCNEILRDPRVLDCLHTFCMECLFEFETSAKSSVKVSLAPSSMKERESSREYESDAIVSVI